MNPTSPIALEVRSLIEAVCDGIADDAQLRDLQSLLRNSEDACNFYIDFLNLEADLQWLIGSREDGIAAHTAIISSSQTSAPIPILPPQFDIARTNFFSDWPLAYLIATVILGVGLLIGAITQVSPITRLAGNSSQISDHKIASVPTIQSVGRITGMSDCQFTDQAAMTFSGAYVSLGRRYSLSSGLMEITYNSGAKVILQGPCNYEVTSSAAGYLSVGKLTARIEKKGEGVREKGDKQVASGEWLVASKGERGEGRGERANNLESEIRNLKSPATQIPNYKLQISLAPSPSPLAPSLSPDPCPLFSVQTPTGSVTDLGTEFAVEVTDDGTSNVVVFEGEVVADLKKIGGTHAEPVHLKAGQSASMERVKVIRRDSPAISGIVRTMPAIVQSFQITNRTGDGADAVVANGETTDQNFGGASGVKLRRSTSGSCLKFYLRFNLRTLAGWRPESATLSLALTESDLGKDDVVQCDVYGMKDGSSGDASPGAGGWREGIGDGNKIIIHDKDNVITWNSAPANSKTAEGPHPDLVPLGYFEVTGKMQPEEIVLFKSEKLAEWLATDTNGLATLVIVQRNVRPTIGPNGIGFASREHGTLPPPTLHIEARGVRKTHKKQTDSMPVKTEINTGKP